MEAAQQIRGHRADIIVADDYVDAPALLRQRMERFIAHMPRKQKREMLRALGNSVGYGAGIRKAITAKHAARLANLKEFT